MQRHKDWAEQPGGQTTSFSHSMRAAVLLASVAALAATCLGSSHSLSLGKSSFSWKTGRRLQTGGPGPNPACISAVNGLLACTGSWGGDDRSTPVECCGGMNDIIAHCGNGSIFDTAVFILDHVDQDVSANATVPMMSLLGGCHRALTCAPSNSVCRVKFMRFSVRNRRRHKSGRLSGCGCGRERVQPNRGVLPSLPQSSPGVFGCGQRHG
jgi:hypothetical protein